MKLRQYSRNPARLARLLSLSSLLIITACGCTSSTAPVYSKENIAEAIQDISKKEYDLDVTAKLVGSTLWIYLPVEDLFVAPDKPEKYTERFQIEENKEEFDGSKLRLQYSIKLIPDQDKFQQYKYNKEVLEKISKVWKVLRRVIFSTSREEKQEPQFFCLLTADIKNGLLKNEIFYLEDLKKVSYGYISWIEYQHRSYSDIKMAPEIIGNNNGENMDYKDITIRDFIAYQINYHVRLKFQQPEAGRGADIDKEIIKIIAYTVKTYGFDDFSEVELNNLLTENKIILNRAALWANPSGEKF